MKKFGFPVILLLLCQFHFASLSGSLTLNSLIKTMKQEDLINTGLYKLTPEECKAFDDWAEWESKYYLLALPKKELHKEVNWYYQTALTGLNQPEDLSIPAKEENKFVWELAMVLRFQHEAEWLKELLEFYMLMGVQHFYMYNDLSNDDYLNVLQEYIQKGNVEIIEWPVINFIEGEATHFDHAVQLAKGKARWLILADTDEFIFPLKESNLVDFLKPYENYGGVTIQMVFYGTSNVWDVQPGELLIEKLRRRNPEISDGVKSIVQPHRVLYVNNPHFAHYLPGFYAVDENRQPVTAWSNEQRPLQKVRLNHYVFRTKKILHEQKILRQQRLYAYSRGEEPPTTIPLKVHLDYDLIDERWSQVEDLAIFPFIENLKRNMFSH